ncbi:MAG: hypothetical protein GX442_17220 [Candidatus Riflebacteria bacterium]|nr:hypothetical protein [Candidatus Riflebacteria bacterium]
MSSSSLPARSWGLNRGEESFLGPAVGMVTLAGCSAGCLHCYLGDAVAEPVPLTPAAFTRIGTDLRRRGATCLYLVNPEGGPPAVLAKALAAFRAAEPDCPVVVKLGGHEPLGLAEILRPVTDAVSLDVKVFGDTEGRAWLRVPDYPDRARAQARFWLDALGWFEPRTARPSGLWLRHVVLPGQAAAWKAGLRDLLPGEKPPVWVTLSYRPFGMARTHPGLGRPLDREEKTAAMAAAEEMRREGNTVWLA